jgi:predicted N-acyltransferase
MGDPARSDRLTAHVLSFTARVIPSIATIDAAAWTPAPIRPAALCEAEGGRFNPFIAHAFLHALEASGRSGPLRLDAGASDG